MTVQKKMIRNIIIAVIVLGLLGGVYYWAIKWQPDSKKADGQTDEKLITLFSAKEDELTEIRFVNNGTVFTLKRTGTGDSATWGIPEYPDIEFSQTKLKSAVSGFTSISASKEITDDLSKLASFGLADEKNSVTVKKSDGTEKTFILGEKLVVDSSYYIMEKGGDKIYTVSEYKAEDMLKHPDDFRETNLGTIDTASIESVSVSKGGEKIAEFGKATEDEKNGVGSAAYQTTDMKMRYPYDEPVNSDRFSKMVSVFTNVEVISFVSNSTDDAAKYGLDSGYKIVIRDSAATHTLTFGNTAEDGNVYAMYNDCGFIFTVKPDMLNAVKDIKPFDLIDKFAHIYNIDSVDSITVTGTGRKHVLSISRSGSGDEQKCEYKIDDKKAAEDAFKGYYQKVIGLTVTDVPSGDENGEQMCEVSFKMTDGKVYKSVYYEYDERNVRLVRPDGKSYLMLRKYVTEMLDSLDKFYGSPDKKPEQ